jgi:prepilin peptidase CpaA
MRPYLNASEWQLLSGFILGIFMLVASVEDIKRKRVSNRLLIGMLCAGILLNAIDPPGLHQGLLSSPVGPVGVRMAFFGGLVGLGLLLPLYLLRAFGAGDIKLMAALGSFFGPTEIINLALSILVTGGVFAMLRLIWIDKTQLALAHIAGLVSSVTNSNAQRLDPPTQSIERMPFVPAMAVGVLAYSVWRWSAGAAFIRF